MKPLLLLIAIALVSAARAQTAKSRAELYTDINTLFASGSAITASELRTGLRDIVASAQNLTTDGTAVVTSGSYANPTWISSLAFSKLSSVPATLTLLGITNGAALDAIGANGGSYYLSRTNHTGTQAISTVSGLQDALDAKLATSGTAADVNPAGTSIAAALSGKLGTSGTAADVNPAGTSIAAALSGKAASSHSHGTGDITSGTLAVARGGTGQTTYTDGQLLIGNTTSGGLDKATLTAGTGISISNAAGSITINATGGGSGNVTGSSLTANAVVVGGGNNSIAVLASLGNSGAALLSAGAGAPPAFGAVNLAGGANIVSGNLPVANGGTGVAELTANNVILGNGTSSVAFVAPGTSGNVLTSNGTVWTSAAASGGGSYCLQSAPGQISSPADGATYYMGGTNEWISSDALFPLIVPKTGTIKSVYVKSYASTAGSNEAWACYIRVNTTDTLIESVESTAQTRLWSNASLDVAVTAGNLLQIKIVCPTWATNPSGLRMWAAIFIE